MTSHETLATKIFQQHGLKFNTSERAGGWTNLVWLNKNVVLRLSQEKNGDRIRREIERTAFLHPSVGYPTNIATGVIDGYEWSLSERIQGKVLNDVWETLTLDEKTTAIKQIIEIMKTVHSTDVSKVEHITLRRSWYNAFDREESLADAKRYVEQKILTTEQGRVFSDILEQFYMRYNKVPHVLNHGDITLDNLMWHDGNVVSLLDFEHSAIAPMHMDLHSVMNLALDNNAIKPFVVNQNDKDLLLGYSVLFRQRFLEFWLEKPEGELSQCDAYQKLVSLCDGKGGYLNGLC